MNISNATGPTLAFWGTYLACKGVFLGGHLYKNLSGVSEKTSTLLGPVGKASFARKAAVLVLTAIIAQKAIQSLMNQSRLKKHSKSVDAFSAIASGFVGAAAVLTLTHPVFTKIKYAAGALLLVIGAKAIIGKLPTSSSSSAGNV